MKVFLDANIIVSVVLKTDINHTAATRILSLSPPRFVLFTSAVSLEIAFYFASKKYGQVNAKSNLGVLVSKIQIANCGADETSKALANKQAQDFEDGLQYYSSLSSSCSCIVTENIKDFYYSNIEVMSSRMFLEKYLLFN